MRKRGFTVIEIVIVVSLLILVSTLVTVSLLKSRQKAKLARVTTDLVGIASSVAQYAQDNNYQYPADVARGVPPGLERYLVGGVWPTSAWERGIFDWDSFIRDGVQTYQISYRLCGPGDPDSYCSDAALFPNFTRNSSIFYCISGNCAPHHSAPDVPGYCVNWEDKTVNY